MGTPENFLPLKYPGLFRGEPVVVEYSDFGLVGSRHGPVYLSEFHIGHRFLHEMRIDAETENLDRRRLERKYLADTGLVLEGF